jgi:hypothetical protein
MIYNIQVWMLERLSMLAGTQCHIRCASDAHPMNGRVTKTPHNDDYDNNDDDNTINAIWHALTTMMMPFWYHYCCCSMPNAELPRLIRTYHTNSQ